MAPSPVAPSLVPKIVPKPWGGRRLAAYGKRLGAEPVGESWEAWPDAPGPAGALGVTVKFLDAVENLSVQVHPSRPGETKHEAWIVLEPPAGGVVYAGLVPGATVEALAAARAEDLPRLLAGVEARAGDAIALPSGIVHALTAGALVYEISEPRDVTYRIHDWGRPGREMHLAESAAAARPGLAALRSPAPARPGAHAVPLPAGFPFALVRHVGPCVIEARPGRAYTRLRGPGRGETFVGAGTAASSLAEGEEVVEAFARRA